MSNNFNIEKTGLTSSVNIDSQGNLRSNSITFNNRIRSNATLELSEIPPINSYPKIYPKAGVGVYFNNNISEYERVDVKNNLKDNQFYYEVASNTCYFNASQSNMMIMCVMESIGNKKIVSSNVLTKYASNSGELLNLDDSLELLQNADTHIDGETKVVMTFMERKKLQDIAVNIWEYEQYRVGGDLTWNKPLEEALKVSNKIYFPIGEYKLSKFTINRSNVEIYGDGEETKFVRVGDSMVLFDVAGTRDSEIPILEDMQDYSNTIKLQSIDGLSLYDYVLLVGQRNCLDYNDCGESWTLGYPTANSPACYFGEFLQITNINKTTRTITTNQNTMFPSYFKDKTRETNQYARNSSTIQKINYLHDVKLRDFKVIGKCNSVVNFTNCVECYADGIINYVDDYQGLNNELISVVTFKNCYKCEGRKLNFFRTKDKYPTQHHYINVFRVTSSELCGFKDCISNGASQSVDVSYEEYGICSSLSYIDSSSFSNSTQSGLTTHGGSYKVTISNNRIDNCPQGISCRSRSSIITNNSIVGVMDRSDYLKYGIGLYAGYARDCVVSNNTVSNFTNAFAVSDASNPLESFKHVNCIISNNTATNCDTALYVNRNQYVNTLDDLDIQFSNNTCTFDKSDCKGVYLDNYSSGVQIKDNLFVNYCKSTNVGSRGIWGDYDSANVSINGNTFKNFEIGILMRGIRDTVDLKTDKEVFYNGNLFKNVSTNFSISLSLDRKMLENYRWLTFDKKNSTNLNIEPMTIFINNDGSLCYKQNSGTIQKIAFSSSVPTIE